MVVIYIRLQLGRKNQRVRNFEVFATGVVHGLQQRGMAYYTRLQGISRG